MDIQSIATLISTVGFPITACCVMYWQNGKLQQTLSELTNTLTLMNERLKDVEDAVKEQRND